MSDTGRSLSTVLRLTTFLRPYRLQLGAALAALIVTALVTLSIGQGVRKLIDEGFIGASAAQLNAAVAFLLVLILLLATGTLVRFYLMSWLGERVSADLRQAVFEHLLTLHPSYFELNRSGEITSRLTTDTTLLQSIIGSALSMALRSALTLAGALIMLLITNLKLTALVLLCVPLILIPIIVFGRRVRRLSRRSQDSIADVGSYAGEIIQHIKTVQSYTREASEASAFGAEVERAFIVARQRVQQRAVLVAVVILLIFSALAGMIWVGGHDVLEGQISAGELGAFVFYAILVASAVATLSEVYGELQRAAGAADRLFELLSVESEIAAPAGALSAAASLPATLTLEHLVFHYPSRPEQPALDDCSLHIDEGQCLALVGPSGAGKSTVFELLQRFYDPQQGRVLFGGRDLRALQPADLRRQLAVVPQQPALFTGDVAYNIRYGMPEASDADVEDAARAAYAHSFIRQLSRGYASHLGEQGVRLSGGQRQRIAIARAILRNPRVLLLDEATSALDTESEHQVQLALQHLMHNRTTVIIAHRLSTILHADRIAVLNHGSVVAQGSHAELLRSCELYHRLSSLQFRHGADGESPTPPS